MKNKKYNKYNKIKSRFIPLASSGILAGMMILGGSTVYADTVDSMVPPYAQSTSPSGMHMMRRWNSSVKVNALANNLGLNGDEIKQELKSGKTLKQILLENGITPSELQQAFKTNKRN